MPTRWWGWREDGFRILEAVVAAARPGRAGVSVAGACRGGSTRVEEERGGWRPRYEEEGIVKQKETECTKVFRFWYYWTNFCSI